MTTIVASLLLILAIIILHYVDLMNTRLDLIALFTIAFTISLTVFTNAKGRKIFAATLTFPAVQVVFISTSNA